jgi:hypothetical protein
MKKIYLILAILIFSILSTSGCVDEYELQTKTMSGKISEIRKLDYWKNECGAFENLYRITFTNGMKITTDDENVIYLKYNKSIEITFSKAYPGGHWIIESFKYKGE